MDRLHFDGTFWLVQTRGSDREDWFTAAQKDTEAQARDLLARRAAYRARGVIQ